MALMDLTYPMKPVPAILLLITSDIRVRPGALHLPRLSLRNTLVEGPTALCDVQSAEAPF